MECWLIDGAQSVATLLTHVVLLEEVLAQARGHEHPAGLRVRTEVRLAALTPRGRHIRVELHCAPKTRKDAGEGVGQRAQR